MQRFVAVPARQEARSCAGCGCPLSAGGFGMDVPITVGDPEFVAAPYTREGGCEKVRDREFSDIPCDPDTARRHPQFE